MQARRWDLVVYEAADGHVPLMSWMRTLSTVEKLAADAAMKTFLRDHGPAVIEIGMGRNVGRGVFEFYIELDREAVLERYTRARVGGTADRTASGPSEEVWLRIFFHPFGERKLLLLDGYDKGRYGEGRLQSRAINDAVKKLEDWKRRGRP